MDFREKLKHVLWMGDLNASYINSAAIKRHLADTVSGPIDREL